MRFGGNCENFRFSLRMLYCARFEGGVVWKKTNIRFLTNMVLIVMGIIAGWKNSY